MKIRKKNLIIVIVSLVMIGANSVAFSKYDDENKCTLDTQIAKGIVTIQKDEKINQKINQNSFPMEYNFCINNFDENAVNEVDFDYCIEIENLMENFPVSYVLMDCDKNQEIKLTNGKSMPIKMAKNKKETRNFKICFMWREIEGPLADELQMKLKINVVQNKEGKK